MQGGLRRRKVRRQNRRRRLVGADIDKDLSKWGVDWFRAGRVENDLFDSAILVFTIVVSVLVVWDPVK